MSKLHKLILYAFPLYLTTMEGIIRSIFGSDAFSVSTVSSSVSVAGIALLLPLLVPKPFIEGLKPEVLEALKEAKSSVYRKKDQTLAISAWIAFVSLTFVWIFSLSKLAARSSVALFDVRIGIPALIALAIYFVGISFTEIKEFGK